MVLFYFEKKAKMAPIDVAKPAKKVSIKAKRKFSSEISYITTHKIFYFLARFYLKEY